MDCVSEPGFGAHTLSIPSESFVEDCRVMGFGVSIDELRRGPGQIAASPTDIRRLRQLLSMRTSVTAMSHLGVEEFVADIRYLLATIVGRFESKCKSIKHPQRHHGVDRAIELIREKQGAVSIVEVCAQASISARSLSRGFRERFGLSTKQYIVATRLGTVRRRLRRHGLSVTEAACESGFWHLGRFSSDYQRMFGELPSETIRRI